MRCLRCGYCCKQLMVVVVDDPARGIREDNVVFHEGKGVPCKHLKGDKPGSYQCAVHGKRWYKRTPCFAHGQIEHSPDDVCRMGAFIMKGGLDGQHKGEARVAATRRTGHRTPHPGAREP